MLFEPDILNRYQQFSTYQTQNMKVMEVLNTALFERALLEGSYAQSLDQLAKILDLNEDGIINDDIIDIVQAYRSVILCEKEQAEYLKESYKNDALVVLKDLLAKQHDGVSKIENTCRLLDKQLKSNVNNLSRRANRYKQSIIDLPFAKTDSIRTALEQEKQQNNIFLRQAITDYNQTISEYFEGCAQQEQIVIQLDKQRRTVFNDIQMKLQVFHISTIKNVEYALKKMNQKIEAQEISKPIFMFKIEDQTRPVLNKFNINDYIMQTEMEIRNQQPSLNLKSKQATQEIKSLWSQIKRTINRDSSYDSVFNSLSQSNFVVNDQLFAKLAGSNEELDQFLDSLRESKLPMDAKSQLIKLNIYMQNLHKLLVDLIHYLYHRNLTEQTIKLIKQTLQKYHTFPVQDDLKDQITLYYDNILKQPCLMDVEFWKRHFIIKLHEQQQVDSQNEVKRHEIIAEIKFQSSKLLQHSINPSVITQAVQKLELEPDEIDQIINHIKMKVDEK
ncbi:unnamed protein product (macronuclear) [Paramecium tetraurelia]|uniref:EF-hand domain-containing protein n=1 Tax=Paramecium tetraurelia TaxID=5888 RepID=A0BPJ1_PARTE|nr:uncharacterized protein GSPATT00005207001 [Paramecium tetraurelia]CAK60458.1 unnamed protein product [Paramecium tetraurelia]|eukprot:XP_001427856.1 hypothetical protein (macronuclear) [Paramecium tetraurelia strain d4-2]